MVGRFIKVFLTLSMLYTFARTQTCTDFVESTTCGGNVIGDSGIIRYVHSGYGDNTGCFWLIRSNLNSKIEVRLLEDTLSSKEYIEIYMLYLDGEIGGNKYSDIRSGDFAVKHFSGPIILVRFQTINYFSFGNSSSPVPGFTLFFRGCGPNIVNPPSFSHFLRERIPGEREIVTYPESGVEYAPNQLVTYLGLRKDRAIINNSEGDWKIKVTYQDIRPSSYCLFGDALRFYSAGFSILCAIDEQNEFIWRFCQRNSSETHILPQRSSKYGNTFPDKIAILAVFSSDRSQGGKGFVFEW